MSLGLLLPFGLIALAALLLPLLLHLERRTEPRTTAFAALRWLSMQARPQRRIRLEEWWLLLLRLLLLAAVALLFARPVMFGSEAGKSWALVAPGVDLAQARAANRDPNVRWHWLAVGFPAVDGATPALRQPVLSLLREVDGTLPAKTKLTVYVPPQLDGLDGERPRLERGIDWRVVPGGVLPTPTISRTAAPILFVRHAEDRAASVRYLRAAAIAWHAGDAAIGSPTNAGASALTSQIELAGSQQMIPADAHWLVWLAPTALPPQISHWVEKGGVILLDERVKLPAATQLTDVWRDDLGRSLARSVTLGRGRVIQLMQPLLPTANDKVLDAQFPSELRLLFEGPAAPPQRAFADAIRPLTGGPSFAETPKPLDAWLALLVAVLFVLERWFASSARRRATP